MFSQVPQALAYAEALLEEFGSLARAVDEASLLSGLVSGLARLSGCELAQLYSVDAIEDRLFMAAECLDGSLQPREAPSLSADGSGEQLLRFALRQDRVVCFSDLANSLHETRFLPPRDTAWQSLLCIPITGRPGTVHGLLVCASSRTLELRGFADSLARLGGFVLGQLQLLQRTRLPANGSPPRRVCLPSVSAYGLMGKSPAIRQTGSMIGKVVQSSYTVLLRGETGTGKEVVARAIHDCGPRRSQAFIVQNCAALPESLLESELFGYCKGAFTGALRNRPGLFDAANGGTLLLDEVGDMPLSVQAKLLRVLQEGEVRPLGSNDTHKVDVRIVAATHRDLSLMVREGTFREDLYYRLMQFPIELPPLRERGEDIIELARHFADQACASLQRHALSWSDAALDQLCGYAFPGNVRELKGLVERAVLLCEGGELLAEHFGLTRAPVADDTHLNLRERLEHIERGLLLDCLRKNRGNQSLSARKLGLPRRTLLYRLARLNINPGDVNA
ncbi:sigma 54-interacting transcriptional regulator [Pseudomonas lutea]|uniref:Sigma 54-interacting transcriptional regulator n=1 Tax=Pseudomonas lutea TaxID=243924 RepID=A0ABR9A6D5_9PSED|nr:sigma 54-interacting transcriptional regulator [Pseudomonas lutea]MBD8121130.1 sigma 54-interacting transcriptional regulator [Pseudomonas lutea]